MGPGKDRRGNKSIKNRKKTKNYIALDHRSVSKHEELHVDLMTLFKMDNASNNKRRLMKEN